MFNKISLLFTSKLIKTLFGLDDINFPLKSIELSESDVALYTVLEFNVFAVELKLLSAKILKGINCNDIPEITIVVTNFLMIYFSLYLPPIFRILIIYQITD